MFQYEYEKPRRSVSVLSCDSRATMTTDWSRVWPTAAGNSRAEPNTCGSSAHAPPAVIYGRIHTNKSSVPLKVWIIAGASCFAICALLVVATIAITKWGTSDNYSETGRYYSDSNQVYTKQKPAAKSPKTTEPPMLDLEDPLPSEEDEDDVKYPILEKLSIFKNIANRDLKKDVKTNKQKQDNLIAKPQFYPEHDITLQHTERKIEKKDQPDKVKDIPDFKPTLPDIFVNEDIKLSDGYKAGLRKYDAEVYEDYFYADENLYDDYLQSTSMTSYLIEKIQELHDWISTDPDFEIVGNMTGRFRKNSGNEFSQVLKALNESILEGNVTIIMCKLKDLYFGDNSTVNVNRKIILTNRTDLLSFGILTLDVMLLHNIQLMAWESQETVRIKMLKDPDVFAFNALFMEPTKVETNQKDILHHAKRQNLRQEQLDDTAIGKNLLENFLDLGMSTARAAIHLGRAYKNTKMVVTQLSNRENINANIQNQVSRNHDANTHALNHLQTSYNRTDSLVANSTNAFYTELDCVWLLYCRNLAVTAKLNAPYGAMAKINGVALRMLSGELSADKAIDTLLYEALTGWTELRCNDMFPRCAKVNAASVVLDAILQPVRKSTNNKSR